MNTDLFEAVDKLPKCITYKGESFVPIVYRRDIDFVDGAYWAMYAKVLKHGFSTQEVLFHVQSVTLGNLLWQFISKYSDLCIEKVIVEDRWLGKKPYAVNFDKCVTKV